MSGILQTCSYYMSYQGHFNGKTGPFGREQEVLKLMKFRNESKANADWVYSPEVGPFRVLGKERITHIVNDEGAISDPILRLNDAAMLLIGQYYGEIRSNLKTNDSPSVSEGSPPMLPIDYKSVFDINTVFDSKGRTLLVNCIKLILNGKAELSALDKLVEMGVDLSAQIKLSNSDFQCEVPALLYAWISCHYAGSDDYDLLTRLVKLGANVNQTFGDFGNNIIGFLAHSFFFSPSDKILDWYLKQNGELNFQNNQGNSYMHLALYLPGGFPSANIHLAERLLKRNIDITLPNLQGEHAIHFLCRYGYDEVANELLKAFLEIAPAELNVKDNNGFTPLYWSIRTAKQIFVDTLMEHSKELSHEDPLTYLKAFSEYIHENSHRNDFTPISEASIKDKLTKTYMPLLKSMLPVVGGNPDGLRAKLIEFNNQTTMLHQFAKSCPWILSYLLEEKYIQEEDLQLKNGEGITVESVGKKATNNVQLLIACYDVNIKAFDQHIDGDISLDICTTEGQSLLHLTLYGSLNKDAKKGFEIFHKLLDKKIDPNLTDNKGNTCLLYAIQWSMPPFSPFIPANPFIIELLNYGADPSIANYRGVTPLKAVTEYSNWEIVQDAVLGAPYMK